MITTSDNCQPFESTYALLVRSQEKQQPIETLIYSVLIACTMFAVTQFGRQAAAMPAPLARVAVLERA